jgi:hypothetical protein
MDLHNETLKNLIKIPSIDLEKISLEDMRDFFSQQETTPHLPTVEQRLAAIENAILDIALVQISEEDLR